MKKKTKQAPVKPFAVTPVIRLEPTHQYGRVSQASGMINMMVCRGGLIQVFNRAVLSKTSKRALKFRLEAYKAPVAHSQEVRVTLWEDNQNQWRWASIHAPDRWQLFTTPMNDFLRQTFGDMLVRDSKVRLWVKLVPVK